MCGQPARNTDEPTPPSVRGGPWTTGASPRPALWLLLALGAGVRALRFGARFPTPYHWDEAAMGVSAVHTLSGTFPVNFLGNEYQGAPAAYPLAAWFALAGSSTSALDAFAYAAGLLVLWTGWLVARRLLPPAAALATLAVLAVPPVPLAARSLSSGLGYPVLLTLGNVFLLGSHSLFYRAVPVRRTLLGLGIVAGLGWWASPLFLVYLAPFVWLAIRHGLLWRAPAGWLAGGALLGSLPCWVYEALYFPSTRFIVHRGGAASSEPFPERALSILGEHFPGLLLPEHVKPELRVAAFAVSAVIIGLGAGIALRRDRAELRWTLGLGGALQSGGALLWGVAAANLAVVLASPQGAVGARYLLPLYSVLPCWGGLALAWAWRRRRALGAAAGAVLLALHAWLNWTAGPGGVPASEWRWRPVTRPLRPLVAWLEARNLGHAYWAVRGLPPSYEMTYLAQGRVVFADLWREMALPHARQVDGSRLPPFVAMADSEEARELRSSLPALGLNVRETMVGRYVVIESDTKIRQAVVGLPPDGWRVSAEPNPDEAGNLVDRDAATGWSTGRGQRPGQAIMVDLGRETVVTRVALLALDWRDTPLGFRIEVSQDGARWDVVVAVPRYWGPLFVSEHHAMLKVRRGRVEATFAPRSARFVRIVQTGTAAHRRWSAREIFVYAPGPPPADGEQALAPLLQGGEMNFVYTSPWLAARLWVDLGGRVRTPESNLFVNSNGRPVPDPQWLEPFRVDPSRAVLLGREADASQLRTVLAGRGLRVQESVAGPYRLFRFPAPEEAPRSLARDGWRATAGVNASQAPRAIDGNRRTGWTGTSAERAGEVLSIDLGRPTQISRIRLAPGSAIEGSRDVALEGSDDGLAWRPLGPLMWAGPLYWTGWELLRNSQDRREFAFPPTRLRHLRVRPVRGGPGGAWVVNEIDLFE
jgi:hypothetical protein